MSLRPTQETFENAQAEYHARFDGRAQVGKSGMFNSFGNLERIGSYLVAEKEVKVGDFARVMHTALSAISGVEVHPPMSDTEQQEVTGKLGVYALIMTPSESADQTAAAAPTNTQAIPTHGRKA